jgi:hypothetical protein
MEFFIPASRFNEKNGYLGAHRVQQGRASQAGFLDPGLDRVADDAQKN